MTKKKTEFKKVEQSASGVDLIWDGWLNSFKAFQGLQNEIEEKSLQVFENQKKLLASTKESFSSLEKVSKLQTDKWKSQITKQESPEPIANWGKSIEEISDKVQTFSWNSNYAMLDFFSDLQEGLEEKGKEVVEKQKEVRDEGYEKIEVVAEQVKQAFEKVSTAV